MDWTGIEIEKVLARLASDIYDFCSLNSLRL